MSAQLCDEHLRIGCKGHTQLPTRLASSVVERLPVDVATLEVSNIHEGDTAKKKHQLEELSGGLNVSIPGCTTGRSLYRL